MSLAVVGSILDEAEHARLLQDMEHVCAVARVTPAYVHRSMKEFCQPAEIEWVTHFHQYRQDGLGGLLLTGENSDSRCMAITGALIRNFIDARVITLNQLVTEAKGGEVPDPTVMVIPNFFMTTHGKSLTSWQIQSLYDILLQRLTTGRPTVLYVQDMNGLLDVYGPLIHAHLKAHFNVSK